MKNTLEIKNLTMRFGGIVALKDVSFDVSQKSITALIGPNGAGKTTVFNCITGFYKATGGNLTLNTTSGKTNIKTVLGENITFGDFLSFKNIGVKLYYKLFGGTHRVVRAGLARTFQGIRLFKNMTVLENLLVAQHMKLVRNIVSGLIETPAYKKSEKNALETAYRWLGVLNIKEYADRLAGELPYGQSRRLEIARSMCTEPEIICLDEPAAGLNPRETEELGDIITLLRNKFGTTVFLIEHDMSMVMKISDHIVVLDHGELIAQGNPNNIKNDPNVINAYLGRE